LLALACFGRLRAGRRRWLEIMAELRNPLAHLLADVVARRIAGPTTAWYAEACATSARSPAGNDFLAAFAGAGRRLGYALLQATAEEHARLRAAGLAVLPPTLAVDECGRAALLLESADRLQQDDRIRLVADLFDRGDVRERQAVLRVLAYLPEPAAHLDTAVEACRTSVQPVFEAIACENPYPGRHFPDPNFNQMVLKALFVGAPVERIFELDLRLTGELVRMVEAYASERRAAGRSVPGDVAWITGRAGYTPREGAPNP
jgi:hypothetical protein